MCQPHAVDTHSLLDICCGIKATVSAYISVVKNICNAKKRCYCECFCAIPIRDCIFEIEMGRVEYVIVTVVFFVTLSNFCLLSAANWHLHDFPCDRKKEQRKRRRTGLWAPARKLIGLWPIWPQDPSRLTRPIWAQTSCSAAEHSGGARADYNQRKSDFNTYKFSALFRRVT